MAETHERVFLIVVDETAEFHVALRYAAGRAKSTGGRVALLHVMPPTDRQHWMALESLMRQEKEDEAAALLQRCAKMVTDLTGTVPTTHLREGNQGEELIAHVNSDPSISILVLAAADGDAGPGPLVSALSNKYMSRLRIPITIVPGSLTDAMIDAIT